MTQAPVTVQPPVSSPGALAFTGPGALAPTTSLRGSQMLAATIQANPLFGYYYSWLDPQAQKRALNEIGEWSTNELFRLVKAMTDSMGLVRPDPQDRLNFYRSEKDSSMWAAQKAKYPQDYLDDLHDYDRLLERVARGELV